MADSSVNIKFTAQTQDSQQKIEQLEKKIASLNKEAKNVNNETPKATSAVGGFSSAAVKGAVSVAALTAAVAATVSAAKECVKAYAEAERIQTRMTAVWRNVGKATGYSADQIKDYAEAIEKTTYFEAESVMSAAQLLAATEKLTDEGFKRALDASVDLAEAMGTDVPNAASMMSRALSDPETGLRALRTAGINFTDAEKDQIKTLMEANRTWEAQEIILNKVEGAYKGVATSVKATEAGKLETISTQLGNIKKNLGSAILDEISPALEWVIRQLNKIEDWSKRTATNASISKDIDNGMSAGELAGNYSAEQLRKAQLDLASHVSYYGGGGLRYSMQNELLQNAINIATAQERGKAQTEYYSAYKIPSAASSEPEAEAGSAASEAVEQQETLAEWLEKNRALSVSAQEAYYDSQIAAAESWKNNAEATEEEKNMLDEVITTLQEKKAALRATSEEEQESVETLNDYIEKNRSLSATAQAAYIDAQIAMAESWREAAAEGSEEIKILDEIIAKLKEEKKATEEVSETSARSSREVLRDVTAVAGAVQDMTSAIVGFMTQAWDQQANQLEAALERDKEAGDMSTEEEQERLKEIDELRKKSFEAEKANSIVNALINGALAITQCFAQLGPVAGPIAAALVATTTAVQVATIASQQYTPMAKGGIVTQATPILAGEAGPEAIIPLSGGRAKQYLEGNGGVVINITIQGNADEEIVFRAIERAQRTGYLPKWSYT